MTTWRDIPEYEGLYEIGSDGQVKSSRRNRILKPFTTINGFQAYTLIKDGKKKVFHAHRLVAQVFIRPLEADDVVLHRNEDKTDCRVANLIIKKGSKRAKLTPKEVQEIREASVSRVELARKYGVSTMTISKIINKKIWK